MKTVTLVLTTSFALSCGGEDPPACPTNDCTVPSRTVVRWTLDAYPELQFQGDTCNDLDVKTVRIELTGIDDPTVFDMQEVECAQAQASFLALPAGNYTAVLTALDNIGNVTVRAPTTTMVTAGTPDVPTTTLVNLPYEQWTHPYTGTFLFRLSWGGSSCETAVPAVETQTLTLMVGGTTVATATTDAGQKLDGTDPRPCRKLSESFAQFAEGIAMGPATLTVTGKDADEEVAFEQTFDTFIGAAKNNPTLMFDVSPPPPPDPPPDGGVGDAPMD